MASTASTTLSSIREFWRNFDIISLQKKLDGEATELAGRQDKSEISRKMLVDLSREFKKTTPENVRKQVAPLLKSFQGEVDSLSKRSKAAETAFLSLYKRVVEIPDPLPALDQCVANQSKVSKFHDYEIENKKLRDTLSEYNNEFAEVKNQEVTINRLREKLKEYEDKIEETAQLRVQEKEKEMEKSFAERERQLQETQLEVAKKLGETELQVANLKSALESTQSELFDVKSKLDEENEARSSAVEILEADLERANQRALLSERQTESLNEQLNRLKSELEMSDERSQKNMDDAFHSISKTNLERELSAKENEITQLVDDIQRLQAAMNKMREAGNQRIASLEQQLAEKTELIIELETKLRQQADYEEIRRELDILKSVEFSRSPSIEDDSDTKDRVFEKDDRKSLEILLLEKNRGLQSENTKLKFAIEELTERHENLQKQFTDAARTLKEQQELIKQLEADLLSVHALPSTHRGQGEVQCGGIAIAQGESGPTTESELVSVAVQGVVKVRISYHQKRFPWKVLHPPTPFCPLFQVSVRDLRREIWNLKHKYVTNNDKQVFCKNEIDGLRSDNVKLYEKIRFLQSYPNKGGNNREMDEIAVNKYSSQYEARLDPFAAFNKNEKQQRYLGLSAHDRVTLNMGKFILSNKIARAVLYKLAYTESCKRVVAEKYDTGVFEHMQNAHEMPNVFHPT